MSKNDFTHTRYSSLIDTWSHHNSMQFHWPPIVISSTFIILSILIQQKNLINFNLMGEDYSLILCIGIPLILLGISIYIMLYIMNRARLIMRMIEKEISQIEKDYNIHEPNFSTLNHPKGISGAKLLNTFMSFFLAVPILTLGFMITFGLWKGLSMLCFSIFFIFILKRINMSNKNFKNKYK